MTYNSDHSLHLWAQLGMKIITLPLVALDSTRTWLHNCLLNQIAEDTKPVSALTTHEEI